MLDYKEHPSKSSHSIPNENLLDVIVGTSDPDRRSDHPTQIDHFRTALIVCTLSTNLMLNSACDIIQFIGNVQVFSTTPVKYRPYASLAISESQNNKTLIGNGYYYDLYIHLPPVLINNVT
ncbi:hypothetical protein M9H77_12320 [Catharanthus roseus]|uniref:Uncharacterized protein n=1 Tax=Catharanthus roseus TaxID=4058 RepID=A0ACC0BH09_CATRO|nr:hypothetical protein M9H77_12320 [Catharanthus roseus]